MKTSCLAQLEDCNARIFIGQALEDENLDPASADQLYAHFFYPKTRTFLSRDWKMPIIVLMIRINPASNGWKIVMSKILAWFLAPDIMALF